MATAPRPAPTVRVCAECGGELPAKKLNRGKPRMFCSDACKQAHGNRMASRGKTLTKVALGWRLARGSGDMGPILFAEMTKMLDTWNEEDRMMGRMRGDDYARFMFDDMPTTNYMDRQAARLHCSEGHQGCERHSPTTAGVNLNTAKKMARDAGWIVNGNYACCANCKD